MNEPKDDRPVIKVAKKVLWAVEELLPGIVLACIVLVISADVGMRYIFNSPIRGASDLSLIGIIWLVYLTAGANARRGTHIELDFFYSRFSDRGRAILDSIVEILSLTIFIIVFVTAAMLLSTGVWVPRPATGVSTAFVTLSVPVGMGLMILHTLLRLVKAVKAIASGVYTRDVERLDDGFDEDDLEAVPSALTQTRIERSAP